MYTKSSRFYDSMYAFKDYQGEVEALLADIGRHDPKARTMLDVACGTGRVMELVGDRLVTAGLDLNVEMLEIARGRLPDADLFVEDMRRFDLGNSFDVVSCLFSSIAYTRDEQGLRDAIASMARHLAPGGLLLVEPWFTPASYWRRHVAANFVDEPDLRLAWMYVQEQEGDLAILDIEYLVAESNRVHRFTERHELGLFSEVQFHEAFEAAGLQWFHEPHGYMGRGLYRASDALAEADRLPVKR